MHVRSSTARETSLPPSRPGSTQVGAVRCSLGQQVLTGLRHPYEQVQHRLSVRRGPARRGTRKQGQCVLSDPGLLGVGAFFHNVLVGLPVITWSPGFKGVLRKQKQVTPVARWGAPLCRQKWRRSCKLVAQEPRRRR